MGGLRVQRVLVDANVFYSRTARDWLGLLYTTREAEPFLVCWTEDIMAEVLYHLRKKHPGWSGARIAELRNRICGTFEAGRVTDYSVPIKPNVKDPDDAHVVAAAIACDAQVLLTYNVSDFQQTDDVPYEVLTPDDFFVLVDDSAPDLVADCVQLQIDYWSRRQEDVQLVQMLTRADCPLFATRVLGHLQRIAQRP